MKHTDLKPGDNVWAWYKDYNRPDKLELYFGKVATVGEEYCTVQLFHDEEPSEKPKRPFGTFSDVCTADITEVVTLPAATPSTLPETEKWEASDLGNNFWVIHIKDGTVVKGHICKLVNSPKSASRASLIASAPDMAKILKKVKFIFSNEANYPEGTQGYQLAKECEAILNNINNQ